MRSRRAFVTNELFIAIGLIAFFVAVAVPTFNRIGWRWAFLAVAGYLLALAATSHRDRRRGR